LTTGCSLDNAFSESLFSTLKHNAGYPKRFNSIEEAREWMAKFVYWYNKEHMHTRLCYMTPAQRRKGEDKKIFENRNNTFELARLAHPERWTGKTKFFTPPFLFINLPKAKSKEDIRMLLPNRLTADNIILL
jgi:putative transposase